MKIVRDTIVSLIYPKKAPGRGDESTSGLIFDYEQKKGEPKEYAIEIAVSAIDPLLENINYEYQKGW